MQTEIQKLLAHAQRLGFPTADVLPDNAAERYIVSEEIAAEINACLFSFTGLGTFLLMAWQPVDLTCRPEGFVFADGRLTVYNTWEGEEDVQ